MHQRRTQSPVYADTLLVLLLFLSASLTCLAEQPVEKQKERATVAAHCAIAVFRGGEQIATAGTELLTGLESVDVNLPGVEKTQSGPRLIDLLAALKISDYQKVTIQGFAKGRLATAEYSITRDKMHDRIILSYSRRGTAKLVVPELAFDDWIVDVSKLEIE
ncbi:MAG: hypothetical protein CVV42_00380 [Candidatus Riflebacteria bacterium HGW-Riflebacteria-2]|nr:MAG: hypothetical protein CVV42_00380 [Candidatus Riflebacteria bacterium HGW-Riflebacteria-2]